MKICESFRFFRCWAAAALNKPLFLTIQQTVAVNDRENNQRRSGNDSLSKPVNLFPSSHAGAGISSVPRLTGPWLLFVHGLAVWAECILIGWLMNGLSAALFICLGTVIICAYLIRAGLGGMALASVWVVGWMSWAAVNQLWLRDLPRPVFQVIPLMLFLEWLFILAAVWHLGKTGELTKTAAGPSMRVRAGLFCAAAGGLYLGWRLYPYSLSYLTACFL